MSQNGKEGYLKVPHPSKDGTWVEFSGMSIRQEEVLRQYEELLKWETKAIKQTKIAKDRYLD